MIAFVLAFTIGLRADDVTSKFDVLDQYQQLRTGTARSADEQVKLALWCEARGLNAERMVHLSQAIGLDPTNSTARALLGMVYDEGRWRSVEARPSDESRKAILAQYEAHRDSTPAMATAQWKLACWCDQSDLKPQADAHATATIRLDPDHALARKGLGYQKHRGRWLTSEQIAAEARDQKRQAEKDRVWVPRLTRLRKRLHESNGSLQVEQEIARIEDPLAVGAVIKVFSTPDPADETRMVQILGQINSPQASLMLATVAIHGAHAEVRRAAAETLIRRDPRDFVSQVISQLQYVVKYQVQAVGGPNDPGVLLIDGPAAILRRRYTPPALPEVAEQLIQRRNANVFMGDEIRILTNVVGIPPGAGPTSFQQMSQARDQIIAHERAEASRASYAVQQQLEEDVARLEAHNARVSEFNQRILTILTSCTDGDFGPDRLQWSRWWTNRQGYAFVAPPTRTTKPVIDQNVAIRYQPEFLTTTPRNSHSCFAAGTPVRTRDGSKPIESLQVGDEVLSQDVETGQLSFEPVVTVFHNPPSETLEIALDDDSIVATGIHRFWIVGKGWTMARDLKPGDVLRALGSTRRVKAIHPRPVQPVYNLEVRRSGTFFAGRSGTLVHDNSLVEATPQPFDAPLASETEPAPAEDPAPATSTR